MMHVANTACTERQLFNFWLTTMREPYKNYDFVLPYVDVCRELPRALDDFKPDMVVYNAGTDVLKGDPLGVLDITPEVKHNASIRFIVCDFVH